MKQSISVPEHILSITLSYHTASVLLLNSIVCTPVYNRAIFASTGHVEQTCVCIFPDVLKTEMLFLSE